MRKVTVEFPVVGYAEVTIEVDDDATEEDILEGIDNGDIVIMYDGHSHSENLAPLQDIDDAKDLDIPLQIGVIE